MSRILITLVLGGFLTSISTSAVFGSSLELYGFLAQEIVAVDLTTDTQVNSFIHTSNAGAPLVFGSDGLLYTITGGGGNIQAYDVVTGSAVTTYNSTLFGVSGIAFLPSSVIPLPATRELAGLKSTGTGEWALNIAFGPTQG